MRALRRTNAAPYLMVAPFVLVFALFMAYPLVQSLVLATQQTFGPGTTASVGLRNFRFLMADGLFWKSVWNTTLFTAGSVFLQLPLSLGLALILNRPEIKGRAWFRLIFFAPVLVGMVFVAMMFALLFEKRTGLITILLHKTFGMAVDFPWMEKYAMLALILAALWMYVGFNMVYFLAALQNVRKDLLEAAKIDGASAWHRFIHVTIPAIRPVASFVVLLSIIGSFQLFELPYIMFARYDGAGYDNNVLTVVMYLYRMGFETGDLGYASAIGWMLALILMVFAMLQFAVSRREEGSLE